MLPTMLTLRMAAVRCLAFSVSTTFVLRLTDLNKYCTIIAAGPKHDALGQV